MIDILAIELLVLTALLLLGGRVMVNGKTSLVVAGCALLLHLLALFALLQEREFSYQQIQYPSPAASAGWSAPGKIESIDGEKAGSLLSYLSAWSGKENAVIREQGGGSLSVSAVRSPRFFEPVDSYFLAESSGGLTVFERDPVIFFLPYEITGQGYCTEEHWIRVERLREVELPSQREVVQILSDLPEGGIAPLRISCPNPDSDLRTILASGAFLKPYFFLQGLNANQAWQMFLGFSGLPVKLALPGSRSPKVAFVFTANDIPLTGPGQLSEAIDRFRDKKEIRLQTIAAHLRLLKGENFHLDLAPGFALYPWIGKNFFSSLAAGHAGMYVRQLLSIAQPGHFIDLWHLVPKQAYLIPHREILSAPYLLYRASSLFISLTLASLLWMLLARPAERVLSRRALLFIRFFFLLAACGYLQALDILVFHHIS